MKNKERIERKKNDGEGEGEREKPTRRQRQGKTNCRERDGGKNGIK